MPGFADDEASFIDAMQTASEGACYLVLKDFRPHLSDHQKATLQQIRIRITPSREADRVFARGEGSERRIEISVGFLMAGSLVSDLQVFQNLQNGQDRTWDYVSYIATSLIKNSRADGERSSKIALKSFPTFLGFNATKERELYSDPRIYKIRSYLNVEALALILAHELSHHFLDHVGKTELSLDLKRLQEAEADRLAVRLAIASGHNPLLGIYPFLLYVAMEENFRIDPSQRDYPEPGCRVGGMIDAGIVSFYEDNGFIQHLKTTGEFETWDRSMRTLREEFRLHC
ncbi:MAG TPA: hypothetical protein PK224_03745 [Nitrospira sp.]|nr:hypothetical protein [Nitrospira sp.]